MMLAMILLIESFSYEANTYVTWWQTLVALTCCIFSLNLIVRYREGLIWSSKPLEPILISAYHLFVHNLVMPIIRLHLQLILVSSISWTLGRTTTLFIVIVTRSQFNLDTKVRTRTISNSHIYSNGNDPLQFGYNPYLSGTVVKRKDQPYNCCWIPYITAGKWRYVYLLLQLE